MSENVEEKGVSQTEQPSPTKDKSDSDNWFVGFLRFRRMVTPILIQIFFWIGFIRAIIFGIHLIVTAHGEWHTDESQIIMGVLVIVLGPIVLRVYCELMILFFRIHSTLRDIKNNLER